MKKRKDDYYSFQLYLGKDSNGKRITKAFYGKTQREAKQKADKYKNSINREKADFQSVAARYLTFEEHRISKPELNQKSSRIEFFKPYFGTKLIDQITTDDIQKPLNYLAARNPYTGKPSAKRTIKRYLDCINNIMIYAQRNNLITTNPCSFVQINQNAPVKERKALTPEQRTALETCPHPRAWVTSFLIYTGLRIGEATALTWEDVNFSDKTITINKSYDFKTGTVKTPKTKSGIRVVPIPDNLLPVLKTKSRKPKQTVIHPVTREGYMSNNAWNKLREALINCSGIKFDWHELRHTYASILYSAGVDLLTAQHLLGHSDVKTTMSIYTHLEEKTRKLNIDKLNSYLNLK